MPTHQSLRILRLQPVEIRFQDRDGRSALVNTGHDHGEPAAIRDRDLTAPVNEKPFAQQSTDDVHFFFHQAGRRHRPRPSQLPQVTEGFLLQEYEWSRVTSHSNPFAPAHKN